MGKSQKETGHRFQLLTYRILLSLEGMAANMKLVQCFLVTVMVVFVAGKEVTELTSPLLKTTKNVTVTLKLVLYDGEWLVWSKAKTFCEKKGGMLATLETQAKFDEFLKLQKQKENHGSWIGGLWKPGSVDDYKWITGEDIPRPDFPHEAGNWNYYQPAHDPNKKCLEASTFGFSSFYCDTKANPVCQFSETQGC